MRTGEQSGTECGCQAEVWVSMLVCASYLPVHFHLCIPTLVCTCIFVYICVYVPCPVYGCLFTSIYIMFLHKHVHNGLSMGPCWAGYVILFSGLPPPSPEPQIVLHPYDIWNVTGQDVIFGCEVFAYPMASIEWRKDGLDIQLPGDDPHISVQFRGGPQRFEVTGWLQIQAVRPSDEGTYRCLAHNALGQVEASASLTVLTPEQLNSTGIPQLSSLYLVPEEAAESEEGEDYY